MTDGPPASGIAAQLAEAARTIEEALGRWLPLPVPLAAPIDEAVRYSLFAGGKRLRPAVVLWSHALFSDRPAEALPAACAVEMIHTYSLIHDDLPAMDNDDFRRGRPTSHRVYGEAVAILAGDALLTHAFGVLVEQTPDPAAAAALARELARVSGTGGLIGGQVADIRSQRGTDDAARLDYIHRHKTAALLSGCARMGAVAARAAAADVDRLGRYGEHLGIAFQIVDDILDVTGSLKTLGKTGGGDAQKQRLTYPAVYGLDRSRGMAAEEVRRAHECLAPDGPRGQRLRDLADFVLAREH